MLERAAFQEWLLSHELAEIVGYSGNGASCPVASYIHEQNRSSTVFVLSSAFWINGSRYLTPEWAAELIIAVDGLETQDDGITAAQALHLLESIE